MSTKNPWLTPYQRSFNDIKQQILLKMRSNVPEITDYTEGNILVVIVSIFSAIAEVLHYYIDNIARETFFTTARRYSSLYKHAKLVDYHIKAGIPASTDLILYTEDNTLFETDVDIPIGIQWYSQDGKIWVNTKSLHIGSSLKSIKIPIVQKYLAKQNIELGIITYTGIAIELGNIPSDQFYVEGSMSLTIDNETWSLVDTFAYSGPNDKVYKVEVNDSMVPTIYFGDGINGMLPALNSKLIGSYYLTYGQASNIESNQFNQVPSKILSLIPNKGLKVKQEYPASGGSNYENFEALKKRVPMSLKTLGVAISKEDYESIAMLQDGVLKAYAEYICGKKVRVYIIPDNYGVASNWLISEVQTKLEASKVITTSIQVLPVYIARLRFKIEVFGSKSYTSLDISNQVQEALLNKFSWENSNLNSLVKLSDVYALLDNLQVVDYVNISSMYLLTEPILLKDVSDSSSPKFEWDYFDNSIFKLEEPLKVKITILSEGYRMTIYHTQTLWENYIYPNGIEFSSANGFREFAESTEEYSYIDLEFSGDDIMEFRIVDNMDMAVCGIKWKLDQPGDGLTYVEGDEYLFYISANSGNLSTVFDSQLKYLPIFTNGANDLILDIHETL